MAAPHRNELDAALARITALETELRELDQQRKDASAGEAGAAAQLSRLAAERDQAQKQAAAMQEELARLRQDLAAIKTPELPKDSLPAVHEYNRRFRALKPNDKRKRLGVACARCAGAGQQREMVQIVSNMSAGALGACIACGYVALVRQEGDV